MCHRAILPAILLACVYSSVAAQTPPQQPSRDTSAQQRNAASPAGEISGRVVGADNGRPVKRARVAVTAAELPGGRATQTDESGLFTLSGLPAGRYTLTVSKTGYIALSYGQRRPLQAGTPLQLADGQQLKAVDFRLPRGGAIAGHIYDEDGEPMPGASVRVLRYQYMQGDRRLAPVETVQSDDKGAYRVWGLNPADYYVSATARALGGGRGGGGQFQGGGRGGGGGFFGGGPLGGPGDQEPVAYAPTFFPGVGSVNEAKPITVGISQEVLDIDFGLQLVRTSRVSGRVVNPDSTPVTAGMTTLTPEGVTGGRGQIGTTYGGRIQWDGAFTLANVPPGRYVLRARGTDSVEPQYAEQPLTVGGGDVSDLMIVLSPGATISGAVTFQPTTQPLPTDLTQIRVTAPSADPGSFGGVNPNARVDKNGQFSLAGVPAGVHFIRSNGAGRGWMLKSVLINGRDVIDAPLELRGGQALANVSLLFTDRQSQIAGTVTSEQGTPIVDYTVLAFPTDETLWRPQSRQIMTVRPDQNGKYQMTGLPPGEYYMAVVDPAEQGEWFEPAFLDQHRAGSMRLTLGEGDVKTQDFRVATR